MLLDLIHEDFNRAARGNDEGDGAASSESEVDEDEVRRSRVQGPTVAPTRL